MDALLSCTLFCHVCDNYNPQFVDDDDDELPVAIATSFDAPPPEPEQSPSVRDHAKMFEGKIEASRRPSTSEARELYDRPSVGSVRDAASMFQQKIDSKEAGQQVLRGKPGESLPEKTRNFAVKKTREEETSFVG